MGVKRHRANHPGKHSAREAPEARKMDSLGREPQDCGPEKFPAAERRQMVMAIFSVALRGLSYLFGPGPWGYGRPRLCICRRSAARAGYIALQNNETILLLGRHKCRYRLRFRGIYLNSKSIFGMLKRLLPASGAGFCMGGRSVHHDLRDGRAVEGSAQGEIERYVEETVCWKSELGYER